MGRTGRTGAAGNLEYVSDMLEQLKIVSGVPEGSILLYLIEMARLEAQNERTKRDGTSKKKRHPAV